MDDAATRREGMRSAFDEAVKLRDAADWEGADRILRKILSETDAVPPAVNAVLGHVLWEQSRSEEAISFLRRAAKQSPQHEGISLGLFHCLYEMGKLEDALNEGRRFLRGASDEEYREYRNSVDALAAKVDKET